MNNELKILNFEENELRTVTIKGEMWWVLKDVCGVLELESPHKVAERLDEDEKGRNSIPTPGGNQEMTIISESGLYNVILRSDKPEAKKFRRWVTHEVLPQIRKTGSYGARSEVDAEQDTLRVFETVLNDKQAKNLVKDWLISKIKDFVRLYEALT
jgi:prophage antirepressor-like protein